MSWPTVNLVLLFSFFCGLKLHTNFPYVTSFLRLYGMLFLFLNTIVLVGFFIRPPTPFDSRLNSFAEDVIQYIYLFWVSYKLSIFKKVSGVCVHYRQSLVDSVFQFCYGCFYC